MSILCYHTVDPAWRSVLAVTPADFDAHCAWLARHRRVRPLEEAVGSLDRAGRPPAGVVSVTFDDGFAGLHGHALPALVRHGIPATVFLVAETLTGDGMKVDWVREPGAEPPTLTREQVLEMEDAGVRFGSHSLAHRDLTELPEEECLRDLRASREILEDMLGRSVPFLAYPGGRHDERVRRAAARAGYRHAFTLPEAPEPAGPYSIPRVGIYPGNGTTTLRVKDARWYLAVRTSRVFPVVQRAADRITRRDRLPA